MYSFNKQVWDTIRIARIDTATIQNVDYENFTITKKVVVTQKNLTTRFKYTVKNERTTRVLQSFS